MKIITCVRSGAGRTLIAGGRRYALSSLALPPCCFLAFFDLGRFPFGRLCFFFRLWLCLYRFEMSNTLPGVKPPPLVWLLSFTENEDFNATESEEKGSRMACCFGGGGGGGRFGTGCRGGRWLWWPWCGGS